MPAPRKSSDELSLLDELIVKAYGHPTRVHALALCTERPSSAKEIAADLDEPIQNVSYHIEQLLKWDCLELAFSRKRRAATENFYKATVPARVSAVAWKRLPKKDRLKLRVDLIAQMSQEIGCAASTGSLDTTTNHISRTVLRLDQQGLGEVTDRLAETLEEIEEIKARAAIRLGQSGETSIDTRVNIIQFESGQII